MALSCRVLAPCLLSFAPLECCACLLRNASGCLFVGGAASLLTTSDPASACMHAQTRRHFLLSLQFEHTESYYEEVDRQKRTVACSYRSLLCPFSAFALLCPFSTFACILTRALSLLPVCVSRACGRNRHGANASREVYASRSDLQACRGAARMHDLERPRAHARDLILHGPPVLSTSLDTRSRNTVPPPNPAGCDLAQLEMPTEKEDRKVNIPWVCFSPPPATVPAPLMMCPLRPVTRASA